MHPYSSSNSFNVCSYNLGAHLGDYNTLCQSQHPHHENGSRVDPDLFKAQYETAEWHAALELDEKADVFCLQEVQMASHEKPRPLIEALTGKGFTLIHFENTEEKNFDCAIVLNPKRFTQIQNHSMNVAITRGFIQDVAIANAVDSTTGQRVTFVSAHVPGFSFDDPVVRDIQEGKLYCQAIANKLSQLGTSAIQVMGADMNANPEKCDHYFTVFSDKQFTFHRTGLPTNVNMHDQTDKTREIDFIFTKVMVSFWQKVKAIFTRTFISDFQINREPLLGFDVEKNGSDHLPILGTVTSYKRYSHLENLLVKFCSLFKRTPLKGPNPEFIADVMADTPI